MQDRVALGDFGPVFVRAAPRIYRVAHGAFHREFYRTLHSVVVPAAPVGHFGGEGHTSDHPGKLRASAKTSTGTAAYADLPDRSAYAIPGFAEAESGLRGHRPGKPIFLTYAARSDGQEQGYAASVEAGVRFVNGRRYGSPQAPDGFVGIRARRMQPHMGGISTRALRETRRLIA